MQEHFSGSTQQIIKLDRCISAPAHMAAILAEDANGDMIKRVTSAPAVVSSVPQWPGVKGADVKIRNTFLHVEMEDADEETAFLQACRRRDTHSCPLFESSLEPAPEQSPRFPTPDASEQEFSHAEPAAEPSPEQTPAKAVGLQLEESVPPTKAATADAGDGEQETFHELMAWAIAKHHNAHDQPKRTSPAKVSQTLSKARKPRGSRRARCSDRLWCHMFIDPSMLSPGFDLVKKLIGKNGCNTRAIFESTGTKVRIRGTGSGHIEHRLGREAPVPLMVALAAESGCEESFRRAFVLTKELLQETASRFRCFCNKEGLFSTTGPLFSLGDTSRRSLACLGPEDLEGVPCAWSTHDSGNKLKAIAEEW